MIKECTQLFISPSANRPPRYLWNRHPERVRGSHRRIPKEPKLRRKRRGGPLAVATALILLGWLVFMVFWLVNSARNPDVFQIVVGILVSILALGGAIWLAALFLSFGRDYEFWW